jgi:CheY-like chemotaxis protein
VTESPPAKILLVDDRPDNLLALEAILAGLGHQLLKATSGEAALKQLLVEDVSLILLDVQMPGMDGYETAERIKCRQRTRHVPVIFLTAIEQEAHQAFRGYAVGAVDFLSKPFDPWVLRAKVEVFVELYRARQRLADQAEALRRQLAGSAEDEDVLATVARVEDLLAPGAPDEAAVAEALGELRRLRAAVMARTGLSAPA